jgi:hypothetical protein
MADESWKELWTMADWRVASRAGEKLKAADDRGREAGFARAGMYIIEEMVDTYASLDAHLDRSQTVYTSPKTT